MRSVGIQRRSTVKPQLVAQHRVREDLDQGAACDEILLDLPLVGPGNDIAPGDDILRRDHSSGSGAPLLAALDATGVGAPFVTVHWEYDRCPTREQSDP